MDPTLSPEELLRQWNKFIGSLPEPAHPFVLTQEEFRRFFASAGVLSALMGPMNKGKGSFSSKQSRLEEKVVNENLKYFEISYDHPELGNPKLKFFRACSHKEVRGKLMEVLHQRILQEGPLPQRTRALFLDYQYHEDCRKFVQACQKYLSKFVDISEKGAEEVSTEEWMERQLFMNRVRDNISDSELLATKKIRRRQVPAHLVQTLDQ